jgi:hypothetical protein
MAHYAFVDENNIVVDVIHGIDESELIDGKTPEVWYQELKSMRCIRTSYNGNIRKNYAGIGFSYSEDLDAFIPPKPFDSWVLDEETAQWQPPIPMPDNLDAAYSWSEPELSWVQIS